MNRARGFFLALLAFFVTPSISLACSSSCEYSTELRHRFLVRVTLDNKPLPGAQVEVTRVGRKVGYNKIFVGTTKADGTVNIELSAGEYVIGGRYLEVSFSFGDAACFHISTFSSHKAQKQIEASWGDDADSSRQIAGQLNVSGPAHTAEGAYDITHRVNYPIEHAKLKLDGPSTPEPHETTTDDTGHFSFGALPAGVYVLHLLPRTTSDGFKHDGKDMAIRVDPAAEASAFEVVFGAAICGGATVTPIVDAK